MTVFYEDKPNKKSIIETKLNFAENGGYFVKISYMPRNFFYRALYRLGFIDFYDVLVEVESGALNWEYVHLKHHKPKEVRGIFTTYQGNKNIRISIPIGMEKKFDINFDVYRAYS